MNYGLAPAPAPQAGAVEVLAVEVENAGTIAWNEHVKLAYHWLDDRDTPIVWDGERSPLPRLADVVYLAIACAVALSLGALVFRTVDDRIAVEL